MISTAAHGVKSSAVAGCVHIRIETRTVLRNCGNFSEPQLFSVVAPSGCYVMTSVFITVLGEIFHGPKYYLVLERLFDEPDTFEKLQVREGVHSFSTFLQERKQKAIVQTKSIDMVDGNGVEHEFQVDYYEVLTEGAVQVAQTLCTEFEPPEACITAVEPVLLNFIHENKASADAQHTTILNPSSIAYAMLRKHERCDADLDQKIMARLKQAGVLQVRTHAHI